ncbi:MAG: radical SAM protein [Gallionellaceae bacterium]
METSQLKFTEHNRDVVGLRYVYPVISRRAGGVSIGINLNTNNACNWRCVYCQVPDLKLGSAPPVDMALLEHELRDFIGELLHGNFMQTRVPDELRRINDIALSGNGEPASAAEFLQVIELIARLREELELPAAVKLVLISNGSLMYRDNVQQGLRLMSRLNGEVWFKLDRASAAGMAKINDTHTRLEKVRENLVTAINCCPNTWLQTCWFAIDGEAPARQDEDDYLEFINSLIINEINIAGVLLYGIARPSMQAEAGRLQALTLPQMEAFAARIRALNLPVKISA